jgi:FkbM family methyltransferase
MLKRYLNLFKNIRNSYIYFLAKNNPNKSYLFFGRNKVKFLVYEEIIPIFKEIYMEDTYDINFIKGKVKTKNPTIVDIGANVGYAATFFLSQFPTAEVISFEPLASNFELLTKNKLLNNNSNWLLSPMAVAKEMGEVSIFYQKSKPLTPIASFWKTFERDNTDSIRVSTISLNDIFDKFKIQNIDLLKIDCEGAEYEILYNTTQETLQKILCIAMETHKGEQHDENQESLINFLKKSGFEVSNKNVMLWAWR